MKAKENWQNFALIRVLDLDYDAKLVECTTFGRWMHIQDRKPNPGMKRFDSFCPAQNSDHTYHGMLKFGVEHKSRWAHAVSTFNSDLANLLVSSFGKCAPNCFCV